MQNVDSRMKSYCSKKASYAARNVDSMAQILGEFSGSFTDCAYWLNGRNQGARYDGTYQGTKAYRGSCGPKTGPANKFSDGYKALLGRFHQIQRELGEAGAGWIR
jgi:glucan 1,3-beta-glucosidase